VEGNGFRKRPECRCYEKKFRFYEMKNPRRCVDLRGAVRFLKIAEKP